MRKGEEEGGCGVVGFCCSEARARPAHLRALEADAQPRQRQRRRHRGGRLGARAVGRQPAGARRVLHAAHRLSGPEGPAPRSSRKFITPHFDVAASAALDTVDDWQSVGDLEVKPPDVWRYFVRVKTEGARCVHREERPGGAGPPRGRGRVRQPEQLQAEPGVLRLARRARRPSSCPTAGTS